SLVTTEIKAMRQEPRLAATLDRISTWRSISNPKELIDAVLLHLQNQGYKASELWRSFADIISDKKLSAERIIEAAKRSVEMTRAGQFEVRLSTTHSSKGFGARYAFIPGLEVNLWETDSNGIEAASRLLYVGMTRARAGIVFTWSTERAGAQRYLQAGGRRSGGSTDGRRDEHPSAFLQKIGFRRMDEDELPNKEDRESRPHRASATGTCAVSKR
ncbi:MAG: 3'-5' exonuclease, partial [Candidatus Omnitrophota bacterium]|nr:3'-5' exonuclease [Candidatus Omnitrophota bacterium]